MLLIKRTIFHQLSLFIIVLSIYLAAPVVQMLDSKYVLVVSQNLIEEKSFKLDHLFPGVTDYTTLNLPHGIVTLNNHVYYFFPDGPALLSVPYVAFMRLFDLNPVSQDLKWNKDVEVRLQRGLAALLTAGIVTFIFVASCSYLPVWQSWILAIIFAFGTSLFSSASRGVWSLTWGTFLVSLVLMLIVRAEKTDKLNPFLLATLLSWTFFCKPTYVTAIIPVTFYMLICHSKKFLTYALTGIGWFLAFLWFSYYNFNRPLPNYYTHQQLFHSQSGFWEGLAGVLLSPSRGLFVYSPFILVIICLLLIDRKKIANKRLVILCVAVSALQTVIVAASGNWWGGHCYGPRLMTDAIPWIALLAVLSIDAVQREQVGATTFRRNIWLFIIMPLVLFSFFVNYRGAFSGAVHSWNTSPGYIDNNSPRMWDWNDAQFLRGLRSSE